MIWPKWTLVSVYILFSITIAAGRPATGGSAAPTVAPTGNSPTPPPPPVTTPTTPVPTIPAEITSAPPPPTSDPAPPSTPPPPPEPKTTAQNQPTSVSAVIPSSAASLSANTIPIIASSASPYGPTVVVKSTSTVSLSSPSSSTSSTTFTSAPQGDGGPSTIVLAAAIGGSVGAVAFIAGVWLLTRSLRKKKGMTEFDDELFDQPYPIGGAPVGVRQSMRRSMVMPPSGVMSHLPLGTPNPEEVYRDINQMRQSYAPRNSTFQPYQQHHQPIPQADYGYPVGMGDGVGGMPGYTAANVSQDAYYYNQQSQDPHASQTLNLVPPENVRPWPSPPSSEYTASGAGISESRTAYTDDYSEMDLHKPDESEANESEVHESAMSETSHFSKPDTSYIYGGMATDDEA